MKNIMISDLAYALLEEEVKKVKRQNNPTKKAVSDYIDAKLKQTKI